MKNEKLVSQQLLDAVQKRVNSGESLYAIAKNSGTSYPTLNRWVNGERSISLSSFDNLAKYLGMKLVPGKPAKRPPRK